MACLTCCRYDRSPSQWIELAAHNGSMAEILEPVWECLVLCVTGLNASFSLRALVGGEVVR